MRLYLQFVWVVSIITTYSNTTPVLSNNVFRFFLSVSFNDNFVALFTFCLQIFHLQTSQKKWRDTKVQSPICHSLLLAICLKQQDLYKSRYINIHLTLQHFMYFHFETFSQKVYKIYNIFLQKFIFLIVCFFFIYFGNFGIFLHMLVSAIRAF